jgi:hypothetical protein
VAKRCYRWGQKVSFQNSYCTLPPVGISQQASIEESNLDAHKTDDYRVTATAPPQRRTTAVRPTPASEPPSGAGG